MEFGLYSVVDDPFCYMLFTAHWAGSKGKQLTIANHLFSCDHGPTDQVLKVMLAVSISRIRKKDRLAIAGSEILYVCHE